MAHKKTNASPPAGPPLVPPSQGAELLQKRIDAATALISKDSLTHDEMSAWWVITEKSLEKAFGSNSEDIATVQHAGERMSFPMNAGDAWWQQAHREELTSKISMLRALQAVLADEGPGVPEPVASVPPPSTAAKEAVFLVHGHDESYLHQVEGFLHKLGLHVIVLRDQANKGRTVIEKFEGHASEVGFAVVLLTPDDVGRSKSELELKPRARQNAIGEMFYLSCALGRHRVCALRSGNVEIPSDFNGVLYVDLDSGSWKLELARELKAAGLPIDMNRVL